MPCLPVRALVADSDRRKRQRCVKVEVYIDALRIAKQVGELISDKIYHYSTSNQEYRQPYKSTKTANRYAINNTLQPLL